MTEHVSLVWDNYHSHISSCFENLLKNEEFVDVTLAAEGKYLKVHTLVLSISSPFFREVFKENTCDHPIVFLKDISYSLLTSIIQFIYVGKVDIPADKLVDFVKIGELLQIKGLGGNNIEEKDNEIKTIHSDEVKIEKKHTNNISNNIKKKIKVEPVSETLNNETVKQEFEKIKIKTERAVSKDEHAVMITDQTKSANTKSSNVDNEEKSRPFTCSWADCEKRYTRLSGLVRHTRAHTGERNYACPVCDRRFTRSDHVRNHVRRHREVTSESELSSRHGSLAPFLITGDSVTCEDP